MAEKLIKVTDDYGFENAKVYSEDGGHVSITDYGKHESTDVGGISTMNCHGLGFREWIRKREDLDTHIQGVKRIIWISDEAKEFLIEFLNGMKIV